MLKTMLNVTVIQIAFTKLSLSGVKLRLDKPVLRTEWLDNKTRELGWKPLISDRPKFNKSLEGMMEFPQADKSIHWYLMANITTKRWLSCMSIVKHISEWCLYRIKTMRWH